MDEDRAPTATSRGRDGGGDRDELKRRTKKPSHKKIATRGYKDGDTMSVEIDYTPPDKANPGTLIHCSVGGGLMGSPLAHGNEAPYPESLATFFILSFCPPGGVCCDPYSGSGTTAAMAVRYGRNFVGCDVRKSQVELARKRVSRESPMMFV